MTLSRVDSADESATWDIGEILFDEETISARVRDLARSVERDYRGQDLCVVGVLSGAVPFLSDLVRDLSLPLSIDFVAISRYQPTLAQERVRVRLVKGLQEDISGRHVLVLDDTVDTGLSLNFVLSQLKRENPATLKAGTLLARPELRLVDLPLDYVGFEVDEEFLVGYGLDYQGLYRDLRDISTLTPHADPVSVPLATSA